MKKLFLLFLLLPFIGFTQHPTTTIGNVASSSKFQSSNQTYRAIVSPLTFTNSNTLLNATTGNSISVADLNSKTEQNIGSDYPQLTTTNLNPTPALKFQSLDTTSPATWAKIGLDSVSGSLTAGGTTQCNDITFSYIRTRNNKQGIEQAPQTGNMDMTFLNTISEDHVFASFHINYSISTKNYHNLTRRNVRSLRSHGEGAYLGNTGDEVTTFTGTTDDYDIYVENSGRELLQYNGHAALHLENFTGIDGGQNASEPSNQKNLIQVVNCKGYMKKGILWNAPTGGLFGVNDFLIEDCFFYFTTDNGPFFLDLSDNGLTKNAVAGGTVTIRNCVFYNPNFTATTLFRIRENNCNFIFEGTNYLPASATSYWDDQRAGTGGSNVIENHGTFILTNSPPLPAFGNPPEAAYVGFEKVVTDSYYRGRHMGYRTP